MLTSLGREVGTSDFGGDRAPALQRSPPSFIFVRYRTLVALSSTLGLIRVCLKHRHHTNSWAVTAEGYYVLLPARQEGAVNDRLCEKRLSSERF